MKPKIVLLVLFVATSAALVSAMMVGRRFHTGTFGARQTLPEGRAATRHFNVRGRVIEIMAPDSVRIQHEEIPGYMPAMVMPFSIKNPALTAKIKVGDWIGFTFAVTEDDSWIASIDMVATGEKKSPFELADVMEAERVQVGERVPDFSLVDQGSQPLHLSGFEGKAVLVTFIYTRCPIPNFCPLMSKNFAALQERLTKDIPGRFQLISITLDPRFDTPEILTQYAERYTPRLTGWSFATGTTEQIDLVTSLFGMRRQWEGGLISHNLVTALIGPDGRLVHVWKSNAWTPYEVHRRVKECLGT